MDLNCKLRCVGSVLTCFLIACLISVGLTSEGAAQNDEVVLLFPTNDEGTIEKEIARYLSNKDLNVQLQVNPNDTEDFFITSAWDVGNNPSIRIIIDTQRSNRDGSERVILLKAWPVSSISNADRVRFLEFINKWMDDSWVPPQLYIDRDNDLAFTWPINVSAPFAPVHAEQVYDALVRMVSSWNNMADKLRQEGLLR